jgi:TatD DNase family protein
VDRLLVETDCPFLPPHPYRGKRNEPAYVRLVAERIAELKGMSFDELARATTANAQHLFGLELDGSMSTSAPGVEC